MSSGRPAVCKNRPIVEGGTGAGWRSWKPPPNGAPRRAPAAASGRQPAVIGVSLAETAETPSQASSGDQRSPPVLIGVALAEIAEITLAGSQR